MATTESNPQMQVVRIFDWTASNRRFSPITYNGSFSFAEYPIKKGLDFERLFSFSEIVNYVPTMLQYSMIDLFQYLNGDNTNMIYASHMSRGVTCVASLDEIRGKEIYIPELGEVLSVLDHLNQVILGKH